MEDKKESTNWYQVREKSRIGLGYKFMFFCLKATPSWFMRFLAFPIGFFYWIFSPKARQFSSDYLKTAAENNASFNGRKPSSLKHIISFALNLVENVQSWGGKFSFKNVSWQDDDVHDLVANIENGTGTLCVVSHLGNAQMMKGLASMNQAGTSRKISITTITDTKLTGGFVKLINQINPDSSFHVISSDEIGPDTIMLLQERLEQGELVVIAGDRISAHTDRYIELPFLKKPARFPYGVYLLIALLNAPSYFIFGLRHKDISIKPQYDMFVCKNNVDFECGRKEREERIRKTNMNFIQELEKHTLSHPYQWYNFFDFWN